MSSMVRKLTITALLIAPLPSAVMAQTPPVMAPAPVQTISVPVVQPLPGQNSGQGTAVPRPYPSQPVYQPTTFPPSVPGVADGSEWDRARFQNAAAPMGQIAAGIARWRMLTASDRFGFADYAGFLLSYPGFPDEDKLRRNAEAALARGDTAEPSRIAALFDRFAPLGNGARAQYALALGSLGRGEAAAVARGAWRGGAMSDAAEANLAATYGGRFTLADQDARMDALLWEGAVIQAQRQIALVSPGFRALAMARLAAAQGSDPAAAGLTLPANALGDPGYVFNRARALRRSGQSSSAVYLLATRPAFYALPLDPDEWIEELLVQARGADDASAVRIAAKIDDAFAPGTDVSRLEFGIRDNYTSLMWLGATKALWNLGDAASASGLFFRYGAAARTPQTRSKGFYWAARAASQAGDAAGAARYYTMAAAFADQFYGQLALERLGQPMPRFAADPVAVPTAAERAAFNARPLTAAVREVARESDWPTAVRFFREISDRAVTLSDHLLVAELARSIGRRDLGVIESQAAGADGIGDFQHIGFPLIPVPVGNNWTMDHAISRQESQFAMNAVSHAGARGLMQLMPATAREQAGKLGLAYDPQALMSDAGYSLRLGDSYFARMMDYFGGSYPLAVAAYNAGAGNVNRWLRANGDPRGGGIDWVRWIEQIPLSETRGYVQHVLENAVVYEAMNPARASYAGANPLSHFLGKRTPG